MLCTPEHRAQEIHAPRRRNAEEATQPDWSDKALTVLLDFTQIFGAVSLLEAAQGMWVIASHVPRAYVGVAFLWSFFAISMLHTVSAALEVFEAEFEKNWAVLGLNWTVNFSGLLLFVIQKMADGDSSLPWSAMVAPVIQTIVLAYALRNVPGKAGGIRLVLCMINIAILVRFAVYIDDTNFRLTKLCDISFFKNLHVYIPDDCLVVGRLNGGSFELDRSSLDGDVYVDVNVYTEMESSTSSTTGFYRFDLLDENTSYGSGGDDIIDVVFVVLASLSIVVVGGSFVNLIVSSRWPLEERSITQKVLKALVVCGWVALYPVFEMSRVLGKLRRWLTCLSSNLKGGKYKFELDGRIVLSSQKEDPGELSNV